MLKIENRTVTEEQKHVVGASCDNCGKELRSSMNGPSWRGYVGDAWNYGCFDGALPITLHGSYCGYFDSSDPDSSEVSFVLCKDCADKLCDAFPCFNRAIKNNA